MSTGTSVNDYKKKLKEKIEREEVSCPKCDNEDDFMVNEIGHVFCNKCYSKIPMLRLNREKKLRSHLA